MKVVLFCGGLGTRLREQSSTIPKPLVTVGPRPILWHLMRYYARFGHTDFILCLGYAGEMIREYFLTYNPFLTGDITMSPSGTQLLDGGSDVPDWRITMVDTGLHANLGERLLSVRRLIEGEDAFLANYSDGLSDAPLDRMVDLLKTSGKTACFLAVRPPLTFHLIEFDKDGQVQRLRASEDSDTWINAGFFVFRNRIFDYIKEGEELVNEPFHRLIQDGELIAYRHTGFYRPMDTLKDKQILQDMVERGEMPWQPKLAPRKVEPLEAAQ